MSLLDLGTDARADVVRRVTSDYEALKARGLDLNLTRGKPSPDQLDLSETLLALPGVGDHLDAEGADVRNYGGPDGIRDIRDIWAQVLGLDANRMIAGGNSSLNIMFDLVSFASLWGTQDSPQPWGTEEGRRWICPVPGYDRHFTITETFGFEMIPVPLLEDGPDMTVIRELVHDPRVKGMWSVPIFSNPSGVTYSEGVARALADMDTAAPDFRIVWDNAYAIHTLTEEFPRVHDVNAFAAEAGHPNRFWCLSSTSKVTHAGSGVSFLASSAENLRWFQRYAGVRGIGPNKVNQLAHARFFRDADGVRSHMLRHARLSAPKFALVEKVLEEELGGLELASWSHPKGGYFVSLDVVDGTAARVVELAHKAGIALTEAGSTYPLHKDPNDRNIRIAPTFPTIDELEEAMRGVCVCVRYAALEKLGLMGS